MWKFRFSSVQLLSRVRLFATPWTAAHQTSLSIARKFVLAARFNARISTSSFQKAGRQSFSPVRLCLFH